ncbi:hypothetical protein CSKR_109419 [Clonorchis sinensis]|uniref:Uncharacterized protein n=1 Tax=Clonorchis sinensis TaxID=79923 RepID=A0A419PYE7_CLOSI|nr:hypothetical protein CSKR_109419 [Clonorchis sinensis]
MNPKKDKTGRGSQRIFSNLMSAVGARWLKRLEREFTDRKVRGSNPTSASRLNLSRLGQPGSIPALVLLSCGMANRHRKRVTAEQCVAISRKSYQLKHEAYAQPRARWLGGQRANILTGRSVVRTRSLPLDFFCPDLGNLAASQPSCFLLVAWKLGTERVIQLNDSSENG